MIADASSLFPLFEFHIRKIETGTSMSVIIRIEFSSVAVIVEGRNKKLFVNIDGKVNDDDEEKLASAHREREKLPEQSESSSWFELQRGERGERDEC